MAYNDISDDDLLDELKERFDNCRKAMFDITALNRKMLEMNSKLQRAEAAKGQFLSNMRNEIVDRIGSIMGLSLQMEAVPPGPDLRHLARLIHAECSTLDFQMRNIFAAAELEAGASNPAICDVAVTTIVDASIQLFRQLAHTKGVTLRTSFAGAANFPTDAADVKLILDNLIANAVEFTKQGGAVDVAVDVAKHEMVLTVADEGPGIGAEDVERIFERFYQVDSGTTRQHRGQGLGLTVVKALVDLMGGDISVTPRHQQGSIFTIRIPRPPHAEDDILAEEGNVYVFGPPEHT